MLLILEGTLKVRYYISIIVREVVPYLQCYMTARRLWRDYFPEVDAVVYVVDAAAINRLDEAKVSIWFLF